ncbi:hypothetical protein NC981_24230 [Leptolyngbya sp. DQ-M1]|uniref:hypothetical protein n=1 Tax=Leptolyngbya sp. DQ-M1 TaxID=2933920 RepID=UPI003298EA12
MHDQGLLSPEQDVIEQPQDELVDVRRRGVVAVEQEAIEPVVSRRPVVAVEPGSESADPIVSRRPVVAVEQEAIEPIASRRPVVAIEPGSESVDPIVGRRRGVVAVEQEAIDPLVGRRQEIPAVPQTDPVFDHTSPVQDVLNFGSQDYNHFQLATSDPLNLSVNSIAGELFTVNNSTSEPFFYL